MILARTPTGYIPTFNIRKGMTLLSKGQWITAESDSTELPCYQYTFSDNTYTYSKHNNINPQSCNIPINIDLEDKRAFGIGYIIQNNVKFPFRTKDKKILNAFISLTMTIPGAITNDIFEFKQPDTSHDYSNNTIANMVNGILYHNVNIRQHHKRRLILNKPLTDESMMYMHLASVETDRMEIFRHTYKNLFGITYSFNPVEPMLVEAVKQPQINYTNYKEIINVNHSIFYGLQSQDIDINNFSTI